VADLSDLRILKIKRAITNLGDKLSRDWDSVVGYLR